MKGRITSLLLCLCIIFSSAPVCAAGEDSVFADFTITVGDIAYAAKVNTERKTVSIDVLSVKAGVRALTKCKIEYSGAVIDEYETGSRIDLTNPVSCTVNGDKWTILAEMSTLQRFVNFDNAELVASNHSNALRRNAVAYQDSGLGVKNYGYWINLGYTFDSDGNPVEESTYGAVSVKENSFMNLNKTKIGGDFAVMSTAGDDGTAQSPEKTVTELKFRVNNYVPNNKTMLKIRSANVDWITLSCENAASDKFCLGWQSASENINNMIDSCELEVGIWYKLSMIFRKYPQTESGYKVEIYLDDKFICETDGTVKDSNLNIIHPTGSLKNNGDRDFDKAQLCILAKDEALFDIDFDDCYIAAVTGDETASDDSDLVYEFEKEPEPGQDDNPDPDNPDPDDPGKPTLSEFDGIIDRGFENNGEGWNINPVNLIPNSSFETDDIWRKAGSDRAEVEYTEDRAHSGSRSARMVYASSDGLGAWRNYEIYEINPFSPYAMEMSVITGNMTENGIKAQLSFKTSTSSTDFDRNKITDEESGYCLVTKNHSDWHTVYDEYVPLVPNEKYVTQLAFRMNGKNGVYAYFDDMYFGTVERIEKYGEAYGEDAVKYRDINSGSGMLRLGAYNGLHGADEVRSVRLDINELKAYNMSAYIKTDSQAKAVVGMICYDVEGNEIYSEFCGAAESDEWMKLEEVFLVPEGAVTAELVLIAEGSGNVWFDDINYSESKSHPADFEGISDMEISVPLQGEKVIDFELYAVDEHGLKMKEYPVSLSLKETAAGVMLDGSKVTVTSSASADSKFVLIAECEGLKKEYEILLSHISLVIRGSSEIVRKSVGTKEKYDAYLLKNGREQLTDKVDWFADTSDSDIYVDSDGTVNVGSSALLGSVTLTAVYRDDNAVRCEKSIKIIKEAYGSGGGGSSGGSSSGGKKSSGSGAQIFAPVQQTQENPAKSPVVFDDVPVSHWAYAGITEFYNKGYVNGKSATVFEPDADVTRAEFVKMLVTALGIESVSETAPFEDVTAGHWAYDYICTGYSSGIINGYDNKTFKPDDKVSRQDMAVMIYKAAKHSNIWLWFEQEINFYDMALVADYAASAVTVLGESGIINGRNGGRFEPLSAATRAEAVTILKRITDKWGEE